jgi:hypothetical protein
MRQKIRNKKAGLMTGPLLITKELAYVQTGSSKHPQFNTGGL